MKTTFLTHHKKVVLLVFSLVLSGQFILAQEINPPICLQVSGISLHEHIQCDNLVTITSTANEGSEGTDITGWYFSDTGVHILPGYSKVRILPESSREETEHRTKVGNGTGTGGNGDTPPTHQANNSLAIFPNPSSGTLSLLNFKDQATGFEILDARGNLLKQNTTDNLKNHTIATKNLKSGTYILNITLKSGEVVTKLFIKQ